MLPVKIGTPNNGGSVVTAGGLIFIASATDDLIRAMNINTGETIWTDELPAGGQAGPMVYEAEGRQFLRAAQRGCRQFLVEARLEADVVRVEQVLRRPQLRIEGGDRRAAVAGDVTRRLAPGRCIALRLVEQQPHHALQRREHHLA